MNEGTIAAIATPAGTGGIAIIRISGENSYTIAKQLFIPHSQQKDVLTAKGYTAMYGKFQRGNQVVDEGITIFYRTPHSYTGEDVVELCCHGGEAVAKEVLLSCYECGANPAQPGEFTKRAVLNGRISLTQAESVIDIINASSRQAASLARSGMEGVLFRSIEQYKQQLITIAAHIAAYIDYPEEEIEQLEPRQLLSELRKILENLEQLIARYDTGAMVQRGVQTAIVGSPNVGKSTLFNLLSGYERAIVTPKAGTTRDVIREKIQVDGVALLISDTAGLHETQDEIEAEGIKRSYQEMEQAGLIIAVFDASKELSNQQLQLAQNCKDRVSLCIINKSDLGTSVSEQELAPYFKKCIVISAKQPDAKQKIEQAIGEVLEVSSLDPNLPMLANGRQLTAAIAAKSAIKQAVDGLEMGFTYDAIGVCIQDGLQALSELTGENATESVLNDVFSRFCLGK